MARAADPAVAEWWRELLELARESPLTVAELCRQHDVSTASFYNWRRKLQDTDRECVGFVPVDVVETEQRSDQALPVRVVWPQGVVMEIPATERELVLRVAGTLAGSEVRP